MYIALSLMFMDEDLIALVGILKSSVMGINFLLSLLMIPDFAVNTNLSDIRWSHVWLYLKISVSAGFNLMLSFASSDLLVIVAGWFTNTFSIQAMTIVLQVTSNFFTVTHD